MFSAEGLANMFVIGKKCIYEFYKTFKAGRISSPTVSTVDH